MRMRQIVKAAVAVVAGLSSTFAGAQSMELSLAQALKAAHNNVEVALARSAAVAAQADVQAADRAPFPTLSAKFSSIDLQNGNGDGSLLADRRYDKGVGIDWTWERGNKRVLRTESAQRGAAAAQADVEEIQVQQLLAASAAFFDLAAAQDRVMQVEAIAAGTAQIASNAMRRVTAGDLARQEALRLDIESERAKGDVVAATLDRQRAAYALASVLGVAPSARTLQARADWSSLDQSQPEAGGQDGVPANWTDNWTDSRVAVRADVRAATERVAAARAALDGAGAQKKADITWGMSLDHFPGTSTALLELRMQMPLQFGYHFQGETGRAQAQLTSAQDTLEKMRQMAALELRGLQTQLQSARARRQIYEQDILPRARQVAAQAELAYVKGALTLNDLFDARRTLRATGLEALAARADHAKTLTAWKLRTQPVAPLLVE